MFEGSLIIKDEVWSDVTGELVGKRSCCLVKEDRVAVAVKLCIKCEKDDFLEKLKGISKGRLLFF